MNKRIANKIQLHQLCIEIAWQAVELFCCTMCKGNIRVLSLNFPMLMQPATGVAFNVPLSFNVCYNLLQFCHENRDMGPAHNYFQRRLKQIYSYQTWRNLQHVLFMQVNSVDFHHLWTGFSAKILSTSHLWIAIICLIDVSLGVCTAPHHNCSASRVANM